MASRIFSFLRYSLLAALLFSMFRAQFAVSAAASLVITPLTWNVIGLDSNNVNAGPNNFPVGARVCNTGDTTATDVGSTFIWDSTHPNISLRAGSHPSYSGYTLAADECVDFYYEVTITRTSSAYNATRRYHITASAAGLSTISTPIPREVYVERLVSQNRNSVTDVQLDGVSITAGGTMSLLVGNTYNIKLVGSTATNGYEQVESFINFPNTIFQVNSVTTTYSADSGTDPLAATKPYADGCGWANDPTSPKYRSCTGTGKYGGNITVTYNVTIIGGGGTNQTLNTLIYDFSGSSYHYNSDFSTSSRIASIGDPSSLNFSKVFSPGSTSAGGTATLTFTITNPTSSTVTGVNFTDTLPSSPGAMRVASPATYSTSGCGSPTFTPASNDTSLSFSNGTLVGSGTCTISVVVSVPSSPSTGTYTNTSDNLFIHSLDTGKFATASLTLAAASTGSGICGVTLAQWTVPTLSTNPPDMGISGGIPSTQAGNVTTALASTTTVGSFIDNNLGSPAPSWAGHGFSGNVTLTGDSSPYFQFVVDTSQYTSVGISLDYKRDSNWGSGGAGTPAIHVWSSTTGAAGSFSQIFSSTSFDSTFRSMGLVNAAVTGSSLTYFRVNARGATNTNADMSVDAITITGCGPAVGPALSKAFSPSPVAIDATSTLTFTLTNPNSAPLTGVTFTDDLPDGLEVAPTPGASTTCGGSPTWSPTSGATTLTFGSPGGAILPANGSCTASVSIRATTSGPHTNVSGFITSNESGTNTGSSGSATATLTALQPPAISKLFAANPILSGGTSTLIFTITNPNPNHPLSGISFTDTFPAGLARLGIPAASQCNGTVTSTSSSVTLSGGSIAAGGSCTVMINVTAPAAGSYVNTSGAVFAVISGITSTGNTAADTLTVETPQPSLGLLKQISTSPAGPWAPFITVSPGTNVYYLFTIENTGDVALSPIGVTDATVNTAGCAWPPTLPVASALNDNHITTCVVGPVSALPGDNPNIATAHGTYSGTIYNSSPAGANYLGASPGFSLLKQIATTATGPWSSAISGVEPGEQVYYKFTVVNTGDLPLSSVNVTDIVADVNTLAAACIFSDPLGVGEATACVAGPVTASSLEGTYSNTATAQGTNSGNQYETAPSTASYIVTSNPPDLTMTKAHSPPGNIEVNTAFTWTLTVQNQGPGDATFADGQFILSDPLPAQATYGTPTAGNFTNITNPASISCSIASGTLNCTASAGSVVIGADTGRFDVSVSVTPSTTGSLTNTASADPRGSLVEDDETNNTGSDTVTVISAAPSVSLEKSIFSGNPYTTVGGIVVYHYQVSNTGNISLAGPVTVTDDKASVTCPDVDTVGNNDGSLDPAESVTCTANYSVTQTDLDVGSLTNTASARLDGIDSNQDAQTASAVQSPALMLDKSITGGNPYGSAGDVIQYSYVITNTGNVTLAGPFTLSDDKADDESCPAAASLAPGDTLTCSASYTVTQADLNSGSVTNIASASGTFNGSPVTSPTDAATAAAAQSPSLTIDKEVSADNGSWFDHATVNAGDTVYYRITIANTGNVDLHAISVADPDCSLAGPGGDDGDGVLEPSESWSYTCTVMAIPGTQTNTATVGSNETPSASDSASYLGAAPGLSLTKISVRDDTVVAPDNVANEGDTITYTFTVENTGNVTITNIEVNDPLLPALSCTIASLAPGETQDCTAVDNVYTLTQADIDAGFRENTATARGIDPGENEVTDSAVETTSLPQSPSMHIVKEVSDDNSTWDDAGVAVDVGDTVYFRVRVSNSGNITLTGLIVEDGMAGCTLTRGPDMTGNNDNIFEAGEEWQYTCSVIAETGTNNNTATVDTNETPQASDTAGYVAGAAAVADPAITKSGDPTQASVGETVTFTLTVTNTGSAPASGVVITDPLPVMFDVKAVNVSGAPLGTLVSITPPIGTGTSPYTVVVTLGDDLGVDDIVTIRIVTTVNSLGSPPISNTASLTTSSPGDVTANNSSVVTLTLRPSSRTRLPATGFAIGRETSLPAQPSVLAYAPTDVILEIPSLGVKVPIAGVPKKNGTWNVSWLGNQAGWLEGSAFPSWSGNSVLTGHVYLANGRPGPFVNLNQLKYGDQVVVHAYGQKYTFAVHTNEVVEPTDASVMRHEEKPWLTLVTCKDYDEKTGTYLKRVVVRAVLVKVEWE